MQANTLYGVGLSAERLEEFASASAIGCGQAAAALPPDWELDGAAVLAANLDDESFGEILGRGARICIEIGGLGVADVAASLRLAQASSIFVSLTTVSAYRLPLAHRVIQALDNPSLTALERFSSEVEGRLADPELGSRRLKVAARLGDGGIAIDVIDQGPGFTPGARKSSVASGRGISLIETLVSGWELLDDGRRIRLRFDR